MSFLRTTTLLLSQSFLRTTTLFNQQKNYTAMISLSQLINKPTQEAIPITAVIDTALCVGAGGSSGSLADKPILRNSEGNLIIPGSQLKGRLRHESEKIARGLGWAVCESPRAETMCPQRAGVTGNFEREDYFFRGNHHCIICQMFGNPALPSRVIVEDLVCQEKPENLPETIRPGVTINRRRRVAEDQKLYFLETSPPNGQLKFTGDIYLENNAPAYSKALILAAFHHIHALGGSKSAGMGWLHWEFKNFTLAEETWSLLLPST